MRNPRVVRYTRTRKARPIKLVVKFVDGALAGKTFAFDRPAPRYFMSANGARYRMEKHPDGYFAFLSNDDVSTPIVGWRAWDPDKEMLDRPLLKSISEHSVWPVNGPLVARCTHYSASDEDFENNEAPKHIEPMFDCTCGIWSTRTRTALAAAGYEQPEVFGLVSLAGKIIEHETGYRAAQAYPLALFVNINIERGQWHEWLPPNWKQKVVAFTHALGQTYRVPCAAATPDRAVAMIVDLVQRGGLPRWTKAAMPTDVRRLIKF